LITLTGFTNGMPNEDQAIRDALDNCLKINNEQSVHTVANTIFPASYWQRSKHDRNKLFDTYLENFPRIQALAPKKNKRGLYFERLSVYRSGPNNGHQLEYIISQYKSRTGVRRSMSQASIFYPARDHVIAPRIPFPCLQHVSFIPQNKSFIMNAFYATQLLFNKAYGNYLGWCRLGDFMAHEMGLSFDRMNCFVGIAKMDNFNKNSHTIEALKKLRVR
jgi:thymidylate synthase